MSRYLTKHILTQLERAASANKFTQPNTEQAKWWQEGYNAAMQQILWQIKIYEKNL